MDFTALPHEGPGFEKHLIGVIVSFIFSDTAADDRTAFSSETLRPLETVILRLVHNSHAAYNNASHYNRAPML